MKHFFGALYDTLEEAAIIARDVLKIDPESFFQNPEENIIQIQNEIIWQEYEISPFDKKPEGHCFNFRDSVVQVALCLIIDKSLIPLVGKKELFLELLERRIDDIEQLKLINAFLIAMTGEAEL